MDFIDHRSTANFIFSLSATDEKLRIKSDGNVGIGVSNPSTKLEVDGVITTAGLTTTADINFGDNDKAVFGAGSDLQIYHDGSHSIIQDSGAGDLILQGGNDLILRETDGSTEYLRANEGAGVQIFHNGNQKFLTTSAGIDVTGSVVSDGLNLDGNIQGDDGQNMLVSAGEGSGDKLDLRAGDDVRIWVDGATAHKLAANFNSNGDISFYEDTGTTAKLFWDASAESLGIGTSSPLGQLHINTEIAEATKVYVDGEANQPKSIEIRHYDTSEGSGAGRNLFYLKTPASDRLDIGNFTDGSAETQLMTFLESGNVGIGTSSPSFSLDVNSGTTNTVARFTSTDSGAGVLLTDVTGSSKVETSGATLRISVDDDAAVASSSIQFRVDGSTKATIDDSGNVGIGTSSPAAPLSIEGSSTGEYDALILRNSNSAASGQSTAIIFEASAGTSGDEAASVAKISGLRTGAGSKGDLLFHTTLAGVSSEAMRIDSSGNVGIGTSSPSSVLHLSTSNDPKITLTDTGFGASADITGSNGNLRLNSQTATIFDMADSEAMRLDSSGNLLVGKTSASSASVGFQAGQNGFIAATRTSSEPLVLNRLSSDGAIATFRKDSSTVGSIGVKQSDASSGDGELFIASGNTGLFFDDLASPSNYIRPCNGTGALRDNIVDLGKSDSRFKDLHLSGTAYTNALGVGTTSPDVKVDIVDTAADVQLRVYKFDGTNNTRLSFTADDSGAKIHYRDATNGGALRFNNNAGEMARFDASSNLLVGRTTNTTSVAGVTIPSSGTIQATANFNALGLNRLSGDGNIAVFQKSGTTVGSIGSVAGQDIVIGSGSAGLRFLSSGPAIQPRNADGTANNDAIDIGLSGNRFKDLYLSGGAYLGGTGSANKLDDYEEGTFTPTALGSGTAGVATYTTQSGRYTKIGRSVTLQISIIISGWTTDPAGFFRIGGLPFNIGDDVALGAFMASSFNFDLGGSDSITTALYAPSNSSQLRVYITRDDANWTQQGIDPEAFSFLASITYSV